jgi:catechol 2,3-dioxygenase-like lactoylglutathione lyase family enzyme
MFDHIGLKVSDLAASIAFYRRTLAALGFELVSSGEGYAGFGPPGEPGLWLHENQGGAGQGTHLAFRAPDRKSVQAFHTDGLAAGGLDNGAPGLRIDYSPGYYAAFLIDLDGNNVEAVCFN